MPLVSVIENPFPGLRPFEPDEEYLFFGRESQVDDMIDKLGAERFLAVVGPSGSGKSSLVDCGLRPALHRGLMAEAGTAWKICKFRPGDDPIGHLARALAKTLFPGFDDDTQADLSMAQIVEADLRMGKRGLLEVYQQARLDPHVNLFVIADQFEELFRYRYTAGQENGQADVLNPDAVAFVNLLLEPMKQRARPVYVALTMRSDFLGDCAQFAGLPEAINAGQYLVPRLTRDERRAVIAGPVAVGQARIDAPLLTRLVNDVGTNPDQLSILQHALNRTWAAWKREADPAEPIQIEHYEAIGTMARALDQHAEEAYAELGAPGVEQTREQFLCEKIFKALTDKGSDARGIRRPTRVRKLCAVTGGTEAEVIRVIEVFRHPERSFLMPRVPEPLTAETVIDISHESLMRVWRRLRGWADEEAEAAVMYQRLAEAAALHAEGEAGLWRDPELQLALNWKNETKPTEAWAARYHPGYATAMAFLQTSYEAREAAVLAQRRRYRAMALLALVACLLAIGAVVLWGMANASKEEARRSADEALEQKEIAETARIHAETAEAAALALKAEADSLKEIADLDRQRALREKDIANRLRLEAERARAEAVDNARIAQENAEKAQAEFERAEEANRRTLEANAKALEALRRSLAVSLATQAKRQSDNGINDLAALLALQAHDFDSTHDFRNEVYDALRETLDAFIAADPAADDASVQVLRSENTDWVRAVAYSDAGIAAAGNDGKIYLWPTEGAPARVEQAHRGAAVQDLAFSSNTLASVGTDRVMQLWRVTPGDSLVLSKQKSHQPHTRAVAFSDDGRWIVSTNEEGRICLYDMNAAASSDACPIRLGGIPGRRIRALTFNPASDVLVGGSDQGSLLIWRCSGQTWAQPHCGTPEERTIGLGAVNAVAFSRDGTRFAAGTETEKRQPVVRVWRNAGDPLSGTRIDNRLGHDGPINAVAFSRDGETLASGSSDHTVRLWEVEAPQRAPVILRGHTSWVRSVAFNPEGDKLVSGSADRTVRHWLIDIEKLAERLCREIQATNVTLTEELWRVHVGDDIAFDKRFECPPVPPSADAASNERSH